MKIIRTLIGEFSEEEVDFLKQFGIKVKANTLERFYIDEGDDYYRIYDHLSESYPIMMLLYVHSVVLYVIDHGERFRSFQNINIFSLLFF